MAKRYKINADLNKDNGKDSFIGHTGSEYNKNGEKKIKDISFFRKEPPEKPMRKTPLRKEPVKVKKPGFEKPPAVQEERFDKAFLISIGLIALLSLLLFLPIEYSRCCGPCQELLVGVCPRRKGSLALVPNGSANRVPARGCRSQMVVRHSPLLTTTALPPGLRSKWRSGMRKLRVVDYFSISVYWFAISYLWNSLHPIILPMLVPLMAPENLKGSALGIMTSIGLILAVIVQPAAGAVSDRTTSRWGRRRPYILFGTLFELLFLLGIALAGNSCFASRGSPITVERRLA